MEHRLAGPLRTGGRREFVERDGRVMRLQPVREWVSSASTCYRESTWHQCAVPALHHVVTVVLLHRTNITYDDILYYTTLYYIILYYTIL